MATVRLNKDNNFRANVIATRTSITFLVNGTTADCFVYMPPRGRLLGQQQGVTAGNIATINGAVVGNELEVQINRRDGKPGNATVTY